MENFEVNSFWGYENVSSGNYANIVLNKSFDELAEIVKNPMNNNEELRNLSKEIYSSSGIFSNVIDYMTSILTLDRIVISKSKRNKERTENILRKIKDKEFIRDMLFRAMIYGVSVSYLETARKPRNNQKFMTDYDVKSIAEINSNEINVSVCNLPIDYIQIVGIKNGSYEIAFDLNYFTNFSGEKLENKLKRYPKEIREAFLKRTKNSGLPNWYVLDASKTITLKIRSSREEKWGRALLCFKLLKIFCIRTIGLTPKEMSFRKLTVGFSIWNFLKAKSPERVL